MANSMKGDLTAPYAARSQPFLAVLAGGLIVGVLDLVYAIAVYSPHNPIVIPQGIASGLLGEKSYAGGAKTAVLGVVLHFVIAFGAATVYYVASRRLAFLVKRPGLAGPIYGALVYLFMHFVVLPLSAFPKQPMHLDLYQVCEFIWHCLCVGPPIAFSVRHFAPGMVAREAIPERR